MLLALACILVMNEGLGEVCPEVNLVNAVFLDCNMLDGELEFLE